MNPYAHKLTAWCMFLAILSPPVLAQDAAAQVKPLRVTAIPDANKDTLKEDQATISAWLEKQIGVPVLFIPVENYNAAVTALVSGQAEMAWLGGVTTVQAMMLSKGKVLPLVTRENDLKFKSYVIARTELGAKSLKDLKGKAFTFGSKSSTSGHVMPRHFLVQEGVQPEKFFSRVAYSGDHTKTVLDVATGAVDAGAVNYTYFDRMVAEVKKDPKKYPADLSKVQVLWTTPEFVDYAWCVRSDVDQRCGPGVTARIKAAFTGLDAKGEADQRILKVQSTQKYVAARPEWWDGIKAVLESTDISK